MGASDAGVMSFTVYHLIHKSSLCVDGRQRRLGQRRPGCMVHFDTGSVTVKSLSLQPVSILLKLRGCI